MAKKIAQKPEENKRKNMSKHITKTQSDSILSSKCKPIDRVDLKKEQQSNIISLRKTRSRKQIKQQQVPQESIFKSKSKNNPSSMAPTIVIKTKQEEPAQSSMDYNFKIQFNKYIVKLHSTYQIDSKHQLFTSIEDLYLLFIQKQKRKAKKMHSICKYTYYPAFEYLLKGQKITDDKCSICQFEFEAPASLQKQLLMESAEDIIALPCSHTLHSGCLVQLIRGRDWVKCPVCSSIYGEMVGDQPFGSMSVQTDSQRHCEGYPQAPTIIIVYDFPSGVRDGVPYSGTRRTAYLPSTELGKEILRLLTAAFNRKLTFTVGRSVTTGKDNQVVWNGIHHKTKLSGGSANFGYPDQTYFQRVRLELAAKGIR